MTDSTKPDAEVAQAELLCDATRLQAVIHRLAQDINSTLSGEEPLVLCVMNGAVIFAGQLLPLLDFPLYFDYVQVTRYHETLRGSELKWIVAPPVNLRGRVVLIVDDVLDEGRTLAAICERILNGGARACYSAVLVDKQIDREKPIQADFVGMQLPDRYLFGFGMDLHGKWRNLPEIYAIKQ
ncbi:MAG: hypoxanthine-guanine phosphoribosyltransferase [Nitrosomonas sp.]|nr:hypoxanthine-guanine phosphoribosyltransferase [Nitrosomonas sp.]